MDRKREIKREREKKSINKAIDEFLFQTRTKNVHKERNMTKRCDW